MDDLSSPTGPNEGRFARDFGDIKNIGDGNFSTVYRARNRLDNHEYAVKQTTPISPGTQSNELVEIVALAAMAAADSGCVNIVRYFSSWIEDNRLHIQTELCKCSLRNMMVRRAGKQPLNPQYSETDMFQVLGDVANGLSALHERNYVHMDIKPDNILLSHGQRLGGAEHIYKIADLGLATAAMRSGCDGITEGDSRYLSREVLKGDLSQLPRADVFSLGLVCYELLTNPRPLAASGDEWQQMRDGHFKELPALEPSCWELLMKMMHPVASKRPSCKEILENPSVAPVDRQLQQERLQRLEAEAAAARSREQAKEYFSEMMSMKKQELLRGMNEPDADTDDQTITLAVCGRPFATPAASGLKRSHRRANSF